MGYIDLLVKILNNEDSTDDTREYCCRILFNMAENIPQVLQECLRPSLQLLPLLQSRIAKIRGKEEYNVSICCFKKAIYLKN